VKLKHLTIWNKARRKNAQLYNNLLANGPYVVTPVEADYARHVYHIYAIRVQDRDIFITRLAEKNIYNGIHYPIPIHLQEAYKFLGCRKGSFPVAEKCSSQMVSLPMFPELTQEQIEQVCHEIKLSVKENI